MIQVSARGRWMSLPDCVSAGRVAAGSVTAGRVTAEGVTEKAGRGA
jgi:hypothetical protein